MQSVITRDAGVGVRWDVGAGVGDTRSVFIAMRTTGRVTDLFVKRTRAATNIAEPGFGTRVVRDRVRVRRSRHGE